MSKKTVYLTFDIEPFWVNIPVRHERSNWQTERDDSLRCFLEIIDLCDILAVKATFFFVAEWGKLHPEALRLCLQKGHAVGSHSMYHDDLSRMTDAEAYNDMLMSKEVLEEIVNQKIIYFRAPSFALRPSQLELVERAGYQIDSSGTSAARIFGGDNTTGYIRNKRVIRCNLEGCKIFGKELTLLGGGYLRVVPPLILKYLTQFDLGNMIYLHPVDFQRKVPKYPHLKFFENLRKRAKFGSMKRKLMILNKAYDLKPLPVSPYDNL